MDSKISALQFILHLIAWSGSNSDWLLVLSCHGFKRRSSLSSQLQELIAWKDGLLASLVIAILIFLAGLQLFRSLQGFQYTSSSRDGFPAKPMLFPGRTAHTRFFPKRHNFSYPFLTVGVPVGFRGTVGGMISVDVPVTTSPWYQRVLSLRSWSAWFTVNGDDYLARGHAVGGLEEKLHSYLIVQGENPEEYPFTYLITPPRIFGYYSNPVSIWHLYSLDGVLSAMILEVNNTFNEKHSYFVKRAHSRKKGDLKTTEESSTRFHHQWPKDFHVSVFNSRSGSYSVSATDPLLPGTKSEGYLDETITLSSSKGHTKLVARVHSTSPALDPGSMTVAEKVRFLSQWWWVGFATFPRTVIQAVTILFGVGLSWVTRPEPRQDTLPRDADDGEIVIEKVLRQYLREIVERSEKPLTVKYGTAGLGVPQEEVICSPSAQLVGNCEEVDIKVLTPLFYSRIVCYSDFIHGLKGEHFDNQTVQVKNIEVLEGCHISPEVDEHRTMIDLWHLKLLMWLRSAPGPIVNAETSKIRARNGLRKEKPSKEHKMISGLDSVIFISKQPTTQKNDYTRVLLRIFIARYIAFGSVDLMNVEFWIFRIAVMHLVVKNWLA